MSKQKSSIMLKQTNLYEEARRRCKELLSIRKALEVSLAKAPPERIHVMCSGEKAKFYLRSEKTDKTGVYIPKSETAKIQTYVQKQYDDKVLKLINQEIHILERILRKSENIINEIQQVYSNNPQEVKKYLHPLDMSDEDFINYWQSIPYERKPIPDYMPFYETKRKERVRSKSEINIANALVEHGIPYKYECPLILKNGAKIHPDFKVLNIRERREIYWEHRGMMDDKDYAKSSVLRLKTLLQNGIFLGRDLIITEETSANPLGMDEIDAIIKQYFYYGK